MTKAFLRRLAAAIVLSLVAPRAVAARSPRISVVRAEDADPIILEIANRTRAELIAAGLDAIIVDCPRADLGCSSPDGAFSDGTARARVITARDGTGMVTEVDVAAPGRESPLIVRLTVGADSPDRDDPATLAVRAAELVRAALLQAHDARRAAPPAIPALEEITYDFEQPRHETTTMGGSGWFVGAGAATLQATDGFGGAYGPALRAGYSGVGWSRLALAVSIAGPAWTGDRRLDEGRVSLRQELAAAQACLSFRSRRRIQPRVAVGAGLYHLAARGQPNQGTSLVGKSVSVWAPMLTTGAGAAFIVAERTAVFVDVEAVFVVDHPRLRVDFQEISGGDPSFLLSAGIERLF